MSRLHTQHAANSSALRPARAIHMRSLSASASMPSLQRLQDLKVECARKFWRHHWCLQIRRPGKWSWENCDSGRQLAGSTILNSPESLVQWARSPGAMVAERTVGHVRSRVWESLDLQTIVGSESTCSSRTTDLKQLEQNSQSTCQSEAV